MEKFDTIRQHNSKLTRNLWVWIDYNRVWVKFMSTHLTHLINGLFSCELAQPFDPLIVQLKPSNFHGLFMSKLID